MEQSSCDLEIGAQQRLSDNQYRSQRVLWAVLKERMLVPAVQ